MKLVERMAREICKAHGWDSADFMVKPGTPLIRGPKDCTFISDVDIERRVELWRLFIPEAEAAIAVLAQLAED